MIRSNNNSDGGVACCVMNDEGHHDLCNSVCIYIRYGERGREYVEVDDRRRIILRDSRAELAEMSVTASFRIALSLY